MELEWVRSAWLWLGNEIAAFGLRWIVVGVVVLGFGGFIGSRYRHLKNEIANLKSAQSQPSSTAVDSTSHLTVPGAPEDRLRMLAPALVPFVEKNRHNHDAIWAVHIALGELGVSWPGPGIDSKFRQRVSALLLEACRNGDMEAARSAWAKAGRGSKPRMKPMLNPARDLTGATPETLAKALFRRTEPLRPGARRKPVVGDEAAVEQVAPDEPGHRVPHLRKRS